MLAVRHIHLAIGQKTWFAFVVPQVLCSPGGSGHTPIYRNALLPQHCAVDIYETDKDGGPMTIGLQYSGAHVLGQLVDPVLIRGPVLHGHGHIS